jgi:WD40 repeat protein
LALSPDVRMLAIATADGVRLIDTSTFTITGRQIPGPAGGTVNMVTFSPDSTMLAAGGWGGVLLIDVASQVPVGTLYAPQGGSTTAVTFSPDGTMLATGGSDGSVRLWDVATLRVIGQLEHGHEGPMNWLFFSLDGQFLVSNDADGDAIVWNMGVDRWAALACRLANRNLSYSEWVQFLGTEPYQEICPNLPRPDEPALASPVSGMPKPTIAPM